LHAQLFEIDPLLFFGYEPGPPADETDDFRPVIEQGPIFVEGDRVDLEVVLQVE